LGRYKINELRRYRVFLFSGADRTGGKPVRISILYCTLRPSVVDPDPELFGQVKSGLIAPNPYLTFWTRKSVQLLQIYLLLENLQNA
jgi:hypothetical protein